MPERRQCAMGIHPSAQIVQDLRTGLLPEQGFESGPFLGLRLADEREDGLGEDRPFPIESVVRHRHVSVRQQVRLDYRLERGLRMPGDVHAAVLFRR